MAHNGSPQFYNDIEGIYSIQWAPTDWRVRPFTRRGLGQGSSYRPLTGNRRPPVPVYRTGLAGYRSEPDKFKFKFKLPRSTGSYRYTGRLDRFTGRFDRYTGRFDW